MLERVIKWVFGNPVRRETAILMIYLAVLAVFTTTVLHLATMR